MNEYFEKIEIENHNVLTSILQLNRNFQSVKRLTDIISLPNSHLRYSSSHKVSYFRKFIIGNLHKNFIVFIY